MKNDFQNNNVAVISDCHIGIHQDSQIWHEITLNYANWLYDILNKKNIKDIIICGDIHNNRNEISVQTINTVNNFFKTLKDFNIYITVGNHDAYYSDRSDINSLTLLNEWKNVDIFDNIVSTYQYGKNIVFCPWATAVDKIPKCDILFGHFDIAGFNMTRQKISASGIMSNDILKICNLIFTGHFHLREERKYEQGTIIYTGCPYELDWGDCGSDAKGVYILDIQNKKYEFIENKTSPKHKRIRLSELLSAGITDNIKLEFTNNFISFVVDKEVDVDKIGNFINQLSVLKPLSIRTEFEIGNNPNIGDGNCEFTNVDIQKNIEEFINMLDIKNKKEVLDYTIDLYKRIRK